VATTPRGNRLLKRGEMDAWIAGSVMRERRQQVFTPWKGAALPSAAIALNP
jgi:hypothetical protein